MFIGNKRYGETRRKTVKKIILNWFREFRKKLAESQTHLGKNKVKCPHSDEDSFGVEGGWTGEWTK